MAGIQINRLTNANAILNGTSLLGQVEECTLPTLKTKFAAHKALGLMGEMEFASGIDKMEGKIKWNSFYEEVMVQTADVTKIHDLMIRGSIQKFSTAGKTGEVPIVITMRVTFKDQPFGNYKAQDNVETETGFTCYYIKMEIDNVSLLEFDAMANVYKAGTVDVLAQYRINIGG